MPEPSAGDRPELDQFVREVYKRVRTELLWSMSDEQKKWTEYTMQQIILPVYFESGEPEDDDELQLQAEMIAEDFREEWRGLNEEQQWVWVQRKVYLTRLLPLHRASMELVEAHQGKGGSVAERTKMAEQIADEVNLIVKEMDEGAPDIGNDLAEITSTILLNTQYILHQGAFTSLEIGRYLRKRAATQDQ
jgi:hypothetical protein